METAAIRYRVADFLRRHPPFQAIDEGDLLALAGSGRVRFFEPNAYLSWQGEPHKLDVSVIQQGSVSLWDEGDGQTLLRDVRGAGDLLGVEQFCGAPRVMHSARAESDVVVYAFPAGQFDALILKSRDARRFVEAYESPTADYEWAQDARDPRRLFLADLGGGRSTLPASATIREAARELRRADREALALVDDERRLAGLVTRDAVLDHVAAGSATDLPASTLSTSPPPMLRADATAVAAVLAMARSGSEGLAITSDGTETGTLTAVLTAAEVGRAFGDRPLSILRDIRRAADVTALAPAVRRVRALSLQHLTSAEAVDWIAPFTAIADDAIVGRILDLAGADVERACWCVFGASARRESITRHAPAIMAIAATDDCADLAAGVERVAEGLQACGYLPRADVPFDRAFLVASAAAWRSRFDAWLHDPVLSRMYEARPLLDLRPLRGAAGLFDELERFVAATVDRDLLTVLANDCLASLPPLTFFQDAVVEESGEQTTTFRLEQSALQPLVDVGRVFGLAAGEGMARSTAERFAAARHMLPEHAEVFDDAAGTLRVLLWQQARVGIAQETTGSELPPALLSRHDRHALRGGFRSILRLIEFTGDGRWIEAR